MTQDKENIYTVSEFAKRLGCTRGVVLRMIKNGRVLSFRLSNATKSPHRIKESEIDRLVKCQIHLYKKKDTK